MLDDIFSKYAEDITGVKDYVNKLYEESFAPHFSEIHALYKKLKSKVNPISDSELEYILIMLPLELFTVAEKLNDLRLQCEVIKLKNKESAENFRNAAIEEALSLEMNKTTASEFVNRAVAKQMIEYEVLLSTYESLITRVTNEQSFAKELIMGAKKVWDSRKSAENSNPVKPIAGDLPDYNAATTKTYIK